MENTEKIELFSADNCKYGFEDKHGNEVIPCIYSYATYFNDGYALVVDDETQYRKIVDATGNTVLALDCDILMHPRQEKTIFRKNNKWGLVNIITKEIILPCEYDEIEWFDEYDRDIDEEKTGECHGHLDHNWDVQTYYELYGIDDGAEFSLKFLVKKEGKWGLIDPEGEIILQCRYDRIRMLSMDRENSDLYRYYLEVKKDGKYGIFDLNGELIISCAYDFICSISDDTEEGDIHNWNKVYFIVGKGEKYGIISGGGKEILPIEYDNIYKEFEYEIYLDCDFLMIEKNKKWGIIIMPHWDINWDWLLNCEYDEIKYIEKIEYIDDDYDLLFCVKKDKKWEILIRHPW